MFEEKKPNPKRDRGWGRAGHGGGGGKVPEEEAAQGPSGHAGILLLTLMVMKTRRPEAGGWRPEADISEFDSTCSASTDPETARDSPGPA